jgi:hypothetical protein
VRKKQVSKDPLAEFERDWKRGIGGQGLEDRAWRWTGYEIDIS